MTKNVRTRMAPSPTGEYHVGHIATLLKNYAFARKHQGKFILRIEDTDRVRLVEGAVERILSVITAYGLNWDEGPQKGGEYGPYVQSERLEIYKKFAEELVSKGKAYYCTCTAERLAQVKSDLERAKIPPKYDRHCLNNQEKVMRAIANGSPYVIRLRVPDNEIISFNDLIRGEIQMPSSSVDDQVLMKSDGFPTYHLGVVVDDHLMDITHVLRGEEWISSTPKHILLYNAFDWEVPVYAHIPVFLNPDGKGKMSKRKGTVSAQSFLDSGYLPEALLNFFMILGWSHPEQKEIITLEEYIELFDPADISPKSVVFDVKKLQWINGQYIRSLPIQELTKRLKPFLPEAFPLDKLDKVVPLIADRLVTLSDFEKLTSFFYLPITVDLDQIVKKSSAEEVYTEIESTIKALEVVTQWDHETIEKCIRTLQETHQWHKSQYFMMLRIALTGTKATPPLFTTIAAIDKELVLSRLQVLLNRLKIEE